jgi:hypothetical protein
MAPPSNQPGADLGARTMGPPLRLLCNAPDTVERSTSVRRRPWSSSRCAPHRTRRASATPQQHGPSGRALPIRQRSVALEEVSALGDSIVQLWATLMAAVHGVVWVLASRWERPGRRAQLRVRISPPPPLRWGGDVAQITPLMYPVLVVVAPGWGYDGWLNWSSRVDLPVQAAGVGIWAVGTSVVVWAAWTLGPHLAVNGLTGDHELIVHGPYATSATPSTAPPSPSRWAPPSSSAATCWWQSRSRG